MRARSGRSRTRLRVRPRRCRPASCGAGIPPPRRVRPGLPERSAWGIARDGSSAAAPRGGDLRHRAAVPWHVDGLGDHSAHRRARDRSVKRLARDARSSIHHGVYCVPAAGLGSARRASATRRVKTSCGVLGTVDLDGRRRLDGRAILPGQRSSAIAYQTVDAVRAIESRPAAFRAHRAASRRRRDGQRVADAVPGRHPRGAGRGAGDRRDDRARGGLPGRCRDGAVDDRSRQPQLARAAPVRADDGRPISARRCCTTGGARSSERGAWESRRRLVRAP